MKRKEKKTSNQNHTQQNSLDMNKMITKYAIFHLLCVKEQQHTLTYSHSVIKI